MSRPAGGRCSSGASSAGAVIQASTSSGIVRITGIAFGWMVRTSVFGSVVRMAYRSFLVSPSFTFRTEVQLVQMARPMARRAVSDAEAAGKAGIRTIGVLCGGFTEASLRQAGCAEVRPGPATLLACFAGSLLAK